MLPDINTSRCVRTIEIPVPKRERKPVEAVAKDKSTKSKATSKPAAEAKDPKDGKDARHRCGDSSV